MAIDILYGDMDMPALMSTKLREYKKSTRVQVERVLNSICMVDITTGNLQT
jgi:hypothetical protein